MEKYFPVCLTFALMDGNIFLTLKSLHIIFVVSWFAGLFYIPRLFIYQAEASETPTNGATAIIEQLKLMTKRLWYIITWPAMVITVITAVGLLVLYPPYLKMPWMHVKLGLVLLLFVYHFILHWIYKKQQKDIYPMSGNKLRFFNELATLLLFAIVFTVVFKNTMSWAYGAGGILLLGVVLSIAILLYKKYRNRKK